MPVRTTHAQRASRLLQSQCYIYKKKGISATPDKRVMGQEERNKSHRARSRSGAEEGREATGTQPAANLPAPTTHPNTPPFKDIIKIIKLPRRSRFGCAVSGFGEGAALTRSRARDRSRPAVAPTSRGTPSPGAGVLGWPHKHTGRQSSDKNSPLIAGLT